MATHILRFRAVDKQTLLDIRDGKKKVETRAATERYRKIAEGDEIVFVSGHERCIKRVKHAYRWPSIRAMLKEVPLSRIMPGVKNETEARNSYYSYPGYKEKLRKYGLVGWELAQAGKEKVCSRGHRYTGAGPCPVCWPGGAQRRRSRAK